MDVEGEGPTFKCVDTMLQGNFLANYVDLIMQLSGVLIRQRATKRDLVCYFVSMPYFHIVPTWRVIRPYQFDSRVRRLYF